MNLPISHGRFPTTRSCSITSVVRGIGRYARKRDEVFPIWEASIEALASFPNVFVKLGGLGMRLGGFDFHARAVPPSSETLAAAWRPFLETSIEAFGPSRAMFESNFPVDKGSYSYPVFWNGQVLAKGASASEKAVSLPVRRRASTGWTWTTSASAQPGPARSSAAHRRRACGRRTP